ncbi:mas-related G-protein coupled receptor member H-like [Heteronotia binoei]|uniref:mas-related G-protein coupled receptor member H-like n=1 Tax=Heteronotia binoei TaxID=13085 RepID=UPI00292D5301|nr:mas-related G-protein coupled receptor member H-like [Heteronotia binoei]
MTNFSKVSTSHTGAEILEDGEIFNPTKIPVYDPEWTIRTYLIIYSFVFVICIFGFVGNGIVIWFLGFCMKRNAFTIYILNLAVADFGVFISVVLRCLIQFYLPAPLLVFYTFEYLFTIMFCTSQFLLTVISIDRCVSVFFPLWHRCHRPPHLSITVCALIWLLNSLFCGIQILSKVWELFDFDLPLFQFFMNAVLCFPLLTVSTLTLLLKVCCKPKQHKRGKLLTVILVTLLVFLIVAFPFNVVVLHNYLSASLSVSLFYYGFFCASLNSGINPLIYFLVGKKKKGRVRENIKAIFQRVFKEDEEFKEEPVHGQSGSETIM